MVRLMAAEKREKLRACGHVICGSEQTTNERTFVDAAVRTVLDATFTRKCTPTSGERIGNKDTLHERNVLSNTRYPSLPPLDTRLNAIANSC